MSDPVVALVMLLPSAVVASVATAASAATYEVAQQHPRDRGPDTLRRPGDQDNWFGHDRIALFRL